MRTPLIMSAAGLPLVVAMMSMPVQAAEFVVTDIGFNGLQRLTPDSLYPVLPITVGDTVNDSSLAASIKALYATACGTTPCSFMSSNSSRAPKGCWSLQC